ncbi:TBC1 domain family member 1-like isoform X2 [Varroa jacobsoni]|uniref:Rab-GAP TBC domain-containing protein n=1 Tax=Varroa destructor TaxID=109461 RepID=A0A7M7KPS0_VARDE|nr:TBC1 domain family member 1-like isoform X2 [Varroa destructor]XP_022700686.1 TBC1 domain family member 1-like isoform X2 [Varroa jacobsoni]
MKIGLCLCFRESSVNIAKLLKSFNMPATFHSYKGCLYLGSIRFESFHSLPMLPWIVAEVRRAKGGQPHQVSIELTTEGRLLAVNRENLIVQKHDLSTLSKFSQISHDRTLFTYIQKYAQCGDNQRELNLCHVYQAPDVAMVKELFKSIRELSNHLLRQDLPRCVANLDCVASFEVLYMGKLRLGNPQLTRQMVDKAVRVCAYGLEEQKRDSIQTKDLLPAQSHPTSLDSTSSRSILTALRNITPSGVSEMLDRAVPCTSTSMKLESRNRTMILILGKQQIVLLSADKKQVSWGKTFAEVLNCVEGATFSDHFAITCVDAHETSSLPYGRLVFKCLSPSIVSEIVLSIKQSKDNITTAKGGGKVAINNFGCDGCPMLKFHNLCLRLETLDVVESWRLIENWVSNVIDESDRKNALARISDSDLASPQQRNEVYMHMLRKHFEFKQGIHFHQPQGAKEKAVLGLFKDIKEKAQKTLSSSFETLLKPQKQSSLPFGRTLSSPPARSDFTSALPSDGPRALVSSSDESVDKNSAESKEYLTPLPGIPEKGSKSPESAARPHTPTRRSPSPKLKFAAPHIVRTCVTPTMGHPSLPHSSVVTPPASPSAPLPPPSRAPTLSCGLASTVPSSTLVPVPNRKHMIRRISRKTSRTELPSDVANRHRTCGELKELWRKAIRETILLNRMERENEKLLIQQSELERRQTCLDYADSGSPDEFSWESVLKNRAESQEELILALVRQGVPKQKRGEIWKLFSKIFNRYTYRGPLDLNAPIFKAEYSSLLVTLTENQHLILVDLARTFPTHRFYKDGFGEGQLSLFNVLKAYSIVDPEVGYCQGLAFVSGVLLLHLTEEEAFQLLKHMMVHLGFRQLYLPSMEGLQVQLYQLWRLLHDIHNDLYSHFESFEMEPALYATPWFLTVFASHFPMELVVRIFDLIFIQGANVVIKVAMAVLVVHKEQLLSCIGFEELSDYLKYKVPLLSREQLHSVVKTASQSDLSRCIFDYETEFRLIQEDVLQATPQSSQQHHISSPSTGECGGESGSQQATPGNSVTRELKIKSDLEQQISALRSQNQHLQLEIQSLQEQLQVSHSSGLALESSVESHRSTVKRLEGFIRGLRDEKDALIHSVNALRRRITVLEEQLVSMSLTHQKPDPQPPSIVIRQVSQDSEEDSSGLSDHNDTP